MPRKLTNADIDDLINSKKGARIILYEEQGRRCNYCGKRADIEYFEVDHKNPQSRGGADRISNYQLLCGPCNKRKSDLTDGEFRRFYKLTPARQAKSPPSKAIPQEYFNKIDSRNEKW